MLADDLTIISTQGIVFGEAIGCLGPTKHPIKGSRETDSRTASVLRLGARFEMRLE